MFDQYIEALKNIIAIDTVQAAPAPGAPFGDGNARCLRAVLELAESFGFQTVNGDGYYGYADIGEGALFGILGHLDTVPFGDGWQYSPLGEIANENFYGRGVLDDKGPTLACLFAAAQLLQEGFKPQKKLRFIFGCNEESGWKCMEAYEQNEEMPLLGFSPDGDFPVINCEKGIVYYDVSIPLPKKYLHLEGGRRPNMVMDRCVCSLLDLNEDVIAYAKKYGLSVDTNESALKIISEGKSAHGSHPEEGVNAFHNMLSFLSDLEGGIFTQLKNCLIPTDGSGVDLKLSDEKSGDLTMNVGIVYCAERRLHFSLDIRYPVSYDKKYIYEKLSSVLKEYRILESMSHAPLYLDSDHPLIQNLLAAYQEATGEEGSCISIGGGTYARVLPTGVAFGPIFPGQESTIHQKDEHASLADLKKMYDVYYQAIKRLCFDPA